VSAATTPGPRGRRLRTPRPPAPARRRLHRLAAAGLALGLLGCLVWRPLLGAIPPLLVERQEPRTADAIVVLAGDHAGRRVDSAAALFAAGHLPEGPFVVSGGQLYAETSWAELMAERAVAAGVPRERVVRSAEGRTTAEEARRIRDLLAEGEARTVLLVTGPWHSGRAAPLFRRELGREVELLSCPGPNPHPEAWWTDAVATRALATEVLKRLWPGPGS